MGRNSPEITNEIVSYNILIQAPTDRVWNVLTSPEFMEKWISDVKTEVISDFLMGAPITIRAYMSKYVHENKGTILALESEKLFRYNYWTKISRLPDKPENYSTVEFRLEPEGNQTRLTVTQTNFPAKASFEHADFYWRNTLPLIKRLAERQPDALQNSL